MKDFADFYDDISGQKGAKLRALSVLKYVRKYKLAPKNILELGVGNGNVIKHMPKKVNLYGLDINKKYLKLAKTKAPTLKTVHSSMHNFKTKQEFDLIYCVFDSINFLQNFTRWKQTFKVVKNHLSEEGLFIFDMYTPKMLEHQKNNPPSFYKEKFGYVIDEGIIRGNKLTWIFRIFEKQKGNNYKLWTEKFEERIFTEKQVEAELKEHFKILKKETIEDGLKVIYVLKNGR